MALAMGSNAVCAKAQAVNAHRRLVVALDDLEDAGIRWPCKADDRWISDDPTELGAVQPLCAGCPVFDHCADSARETRATYGVFAGVIHTDKTYSKPRKAATKASTHGTAA